MKERVSVNDLLGEAAKLHPGMLGTGQPCKLDAKLFLSGGVALSASLFSIWTPKIQDPSRFT